MKKSKRKWPWITLVVVGVLILSCFIGSGIGYYSFMNHHINTRENSRGIAKFEDYASDGLMRADADFLSNKNVNLDGYLYWNKDVTKINGIIIVNNGFGSGHEAMLGEIAALTNQGYLVYGFDKTGFDLSGDGGISSISQGVHDLLSAISYVKTSMENGTFNQLLDDAGTVKFTMDVDTGSKGGKETMTVGFDTFKNLPIILYGRSYGAFCCLAALRDTSDVEAVISMSAFNETSDMMGSEARRMLGGFGTIFTPFLKVFDAINEENYTAYDGLARTNAKVLVMHSADDQTVTMQSSYEKFQNLENENENLHFMRYNDKGHAIIKSEAGVLLNQKMDEDIQGFADEHGGQMTDELWDEFLSQYDLRICTEPDEEVMATIIEFLDVNLR